MATKTVTINSTESRAGRKLLRETDLAANLSTLCKILNIIKENPKSEENYSKFAKVYEPFHASFRLAKEKLKEVKSDQPSVTQVLLHNGIKEARDTLVKWKEEYPDLPFTIGKPEKDGDATLSCPSTPRNLPLPPDVYNDPALLSP